MRTYSKYLSGVAVASLLAVPVTGFSTDGWAQIDEIVVTTRKREENLQDIPVAVSAFDSNFIENQALRSTADVMKLIPGVQFDQAFALNDTRIAIRGINNSRGRASAAVLVDGIDVSGETLHIGGGSSLLNTRLLELERVEVIKGPQAALYGRNAFAGAINYITKRPSMDGIEGSVSADVAEHGRYELRGRFSGPVVEDKLAVSVNGAWFNLDGYYEHPVTGSDLNGGESIGVGFGVLFEPTDTMSIYGNVTYSDDESTPRAAVANKPNTDFSPLVNPINGRFYEDYIGILQGSESQVTQSGFSERTQGDFEGAKDETLRVSLIADWDLGAVTLKSLTGYLNNDGFVNNDVDYQDGVTLTNPGGASIRQDFFAETETEYWSQEFIVSSNSDGRVNWLFGVSGFWEDTSSVDESDNHWLATNPGFAGLCGLVVPCTFNEGVNVFGNPAKIVERETTSYSAYGLLGVDVTDRFTITGELRYIYDDIDVSTNIPITRTDQTALGCNSDGTIPGGFCSVDTSMLPLTGNTKSYELNPRLSADFQITDDAMIYASIARGSKPGGFGTTQMATPSANNEMDPEKLWSYEIGTKTSWLDNTLQINAAGYFSAYSDRQIGITVPCDGNPDFLCAGNGNAGEAEVWGAELDVTWAPTENLILALGYSYIDAEFTELDYLEIRRDTTGDPDLTPANLPSNLLALCGSDLNGNCDGAFIGGVAENALTLAAQYKAPIANGDYDWFISANGQYTDERPVINAVEITSFTDSFWNVDMQLGVESERLRVALYAENVFDDDTIRNGQQVNDFKDGLDATRFSPQNNMAVAFLPPPRVVGVRANWKFGGN